MSITIGFILEPSSFHLPLQRILHHWRNQTHNRWKKYFSFWTHFTRENMQYKPWSWPPFSMPNQIWTHIWQQSAWSLQLQNRLVIGWIKGSFGMTNTYTYPIGIASFAVFCVSLGPWLCSYSGTASFGKTQRDNSIPWEDPWPCSNIKLWSTLSAYPLCEGIWNIASILHCIYI